jgi:hypothetical protein
MRQRATRLTGLSAGGDLSLVTRAINAIRRNQGVLYWPADNFSGMWTDSTGLSPVTNVGDVLGLLGDRTQPMAARRNLLTWSQAFDNADWTRVARLTVKCSHCTRWHGHSGPADCQRRFRCPCTVSSGDRLRWLWYANFSFRSKADGYVLGDHRRW